jgi:hypothetical protein
MQVLKKTQAINQPMVYPSSISQKAIWKGRHIGIILACLLFFIPLCSLPPARIGYYSQVETSIFAFWGLSAFSYLWMYFLWKKHPNLVLYSTKLPIVWGPILLGLITILFSIMHPLPFRDFVGSGQIGEGAITFLACGIMACHFSILTRIAFYRKLIFASALLAGLSVSILTIIGSMDSPFISWRYWKWAAFYFPDFLAFIDIALIAIYLSIRKDFNGFLYIYDAIALSLFALIGYFANNKSLTLGIFITGLTMLGIAIFPKTWRKPLAQVSFFGLTFAVTLFVAFYDDFSNLLPASLGNISTITSRTWLSKVSLVDLWLKPLDEQWFQQVAMGSGWGTFSNISAANMFLIDQVSLFVGKEYQPSWELVNRDLLHTHNIITNLFHSIGLVGASAYLYIQYKINNSLSAQRFWLGVAFLLSYQIQLLFWFQFIMTIPFTLLAMSLLFRERSVTSWSSLLKPKLLITYACLLLSFTILQGYIMVGYKKNFAQNADRSNTDLIDVLTTNPYAHFEGALGAQRQVGLARIYSLALTKEFEKFPQKHVVYALKLAKHLNNLTKSGNYLANNVALNILSELASNPETLKYFDKDTYSLWEDLAKEHIRIMPYRSDILLPFFNHYQTLGKEKIVLNMAQSILKQSTNDAIALWFTGSSQLKHHSHFDEGMCMLQKSINKGIERLMPIPSPLKSKIMTYAQTCP